MTEPEPDRPVLRVVRGAPDAAELAALTAVVTRGEPAAEPESGTRRSQWGDRAALLHRGPLRPGPGAWRASGLPG